MFFSSLRSDHLEKNNNLGNRVHTKHRQKTRSTSKEPPSSPQKKKVELQPRSKAVPSLLFHRGQTACSLRKWSCACVLPGSQLSRLAYQRVPLIKRCLQMLSYFCWWPRVPWGKKCFPLDLNPRSRSRSRRRWFVLSPMSPRSRGTAVRAL